MIKGKFIISLLTLCFSIYYSNAEPFYNNLAINKCHQPMEDLSMANAGEISLKHLHLDLVVSFDSQSLEGHCIWDFVPAKGVKTIVFDVEKIQVQKVEVDNKTAKWQLVQNPSWHSQGLEIVIKPGSKQVKIYYKTSADAAALQWLSAGQTGSGKPFLYTQSQAILARTWVPCFDKPSVRFTYSATIHVPKNLMALMSATNPREKNPTGIYQFKMEQKIPSYLLALAVGDIAYKALDERSGIYAELEILDKTAKEFQRLPEMIQVAESIYGPYRWERYDVLFLPASFPFGGMENPRLTFATPTIIAGDGSLVSLIAHELAHSWSGNLVTNSRWADFWLNEGFTVYFENRIMEAMYGKEYADMLKVLGWGDLQKTLEELGTDNELTRLELRNTNQDPDQAMTDIAYEKGRFFLCHVENIVGREKFDMFLNRYFSNYAFGNLNTADFRTFLYTHLVKGDSSLARAIAFDTWTKDTGMPEGFTAPVSRQFDLVDSLRPHIVKGEKAAVDLTRDWTTHHWLYFLRGIKPGTDVMPLLDGLFHFTTTSNAEIAFEWYLLSIHSGYHRAFNQMEVFLTDVGRRKFVRPLFAALAAKDGEYRAYALDLYIKVRSRYHAVTVATLDELFDYKP